MVDSGDIALGIGAALLGGLAVRAVAGSQEEQQRARSTPQRARQAVSRLVVIGQGGQPGRGAEPATAKPRKTQTGEQPARGDEPATNDRGTSPTGSDPTGSRVSSRRDLRTGTASREQPGPSADAEGGDEPTVTTVGGGGEPETAGGARDVVLSTDVSTSLGAPSGGPDEASVAELM